MKWKEGFWSETALLSHWACTHAELLICVSNLLLQPAETLFNSQDPCLDTGAYCHWRCPRVSHHLRMMAWKCRDPKVWYLSCPVNTLAHQRAHAAFQVSIPHKCRIRPLPTCRHRWQRQHPSVCLGLGTALQLWSRPTTSDPSVFLYKYFFYFFSFQLFPLV